MPCGPCPCGSSWSAAGRRPLPQQCAKLHHRAITLKRDYHRIQGSTPQQPFPTY